MRFLFTSLLTEGGPLFMYTILAMLIICVGLLIKAFVKGDKDGRTQKLVSHISLLALIWGFLGFMMGMINAFDQITLDTSMNPSVFAGGLKIGLLAPSFGMLVFIIARLGIIGLTFKNNN
ncbi:MotA/TolQ/ExbB proton channel family protein [Tenacibaculum aiptasiae]|uniref:MotA/TolQ/ExbB proton channel family protein n=1 Tax=Tenacibaculum aiptasiae TaxID=426481 RepID=UPI003B5A62BE